MAKYIQVITTVERKYMAERIAGHLLIKRVAACVQLFPIKSFYWWKKDIQESKEFMLFIKGKNFKKIEKAIKEVHPYKVPEIISVPITEGSKSYLDWIDKD
mgnify:CR=1 FL=1